MEYLNVEQAKTLPGLRLVLSLGGPYPFGQAAKSVFEYKNLSYQAVAQMPGEPNDDHFAWTGNRNAPVAVYNDEIPRDGWCGIVTLAERLAPEPSIIPENSEDRVTMFGLCEEMCAENSLGWARRLMLVDMMLAQGEDSPFAPVATVLGQRYGLSPEALSEAPARIVDVLNMLSTRLHSQKSIGSPYFVGDRVTAADIYWACIAMMFAPLPEDVNPIDPGSRAAYGYLTPELDAALDPILLAHRDMMYRDHLKLPLDF
jgi:glutathione S-transferase